MATKTCVIALLGLFLWATVGDMPAVARRAEDPPDRTYFLESQACAQCHSEGSRASAMRNKDGKSIAPYDLWQGSMMANSARDPLWRAFVAIETDAIPSRRVEIENKCMRCHTPMASREAEHLGEVLRIDVLDETTPTHLGRLARDGVSCTLCHQITPEGFGKKESYTGHFHLGTESQIFGPHVGPPPEPMRNFTGYTPTHATHMTESALCATCHTLYTEAMTSDGKPTGSVLLEQSPYLEWRNSVFTTETSEPHEDAQSCQACHVPTTNPDGTPITTRIARNPGGRDFPNVRERTPFGQHFFVGGNALTPQLIRDLKDEMDIPAPKEAFDAVAAHARTQLRTRSAKIEIGTDAELVDGRLRVPVTIRNLTGHKFPSAHPTRRAWIQFVVRNKTGAIVFSSGTHDGEGMILDQSGKPLPAELHKGGMHAWTSVVSSSDQVPVMESVMEDDEGQITFRLLAGARYRKDSRLLPRGWSEKHAEGPATAPVGVPFPEAFSGDGARVVYEFPIGEEDGPHTIEVDLYYQTIGARYLAEVLSQRRLKEVARFERLYRAKTVDRAPVLVDSVRMKAGI
jgi:hypothetical protein